MAGTKGMFGKGHLMGSPASQHRRHGFLRRLARDQRGNTMAIAAAAIFPLVGLVGGALDMSRMYIVKTKLQSACDAGALTGRKVMGVGTWAANSGAANLAAQRIFDLNFEDGAFGTTGRARSFAENDGLVTGTASVTVPMTLMKLFNFTSDTVNVTCEGVMRIPNTDVMFVLDTTGSMNCASSDTQSSNSSQPNYCQNGNNNGVEKSNAKIKGLRVAVKCFYEALIRNNIDDVTPAECGETTDPVPLVSNQSQLRIGFMPYAMNVNVGKLLPHSYMADSWTYQSREPVMENVYAYTVGNEVEGASTWNPASPGPAYFNSTNYTNPWSRPATDLVIGSTTHARRRTGLNSTSCSGLNNLSGATGLVAAVQIQGSITTTSTGSYPAAAPVYPASSQSRSDAKSETGRTVQGYRYRRFDPSGADPNDCWLETSTHPTAYNRTGSTSFSRAITWTQHTDKFRQWIYRPVSINVAGLKNGDGVSWNNSITLPLGSSPYTMTTPSGQTAADVNYRTLANVSVDWPGCIEEVSTFRNTDGDPSDDWSPVPAAAVDMLISHVPGSGQETRWKPALPKALMARGPYSGGTFTPVYEDWTGPIADSIENDRDFFGSSTCPTEAKKLQTWSTSADAGVFKSYLNSLRTDGSTYHDIGMLWGARFMWPTGIFGAANATTPLGASIQRNMIFMTDGDTATNSLVNTAYGIAWYDRRQTSIASAPSTTLLNSVTDARTLALCDAIKNQGITLWVISYGSGVNTTTQNRLTQCASGGRFFSASNTAALITQFKSIAAEISELRLTN